MSSARHRVTTAVVLFAMLLSVACTRTSTLEVTRHSTRTSQLSATGSDPGAPAVGDDPSVGGATRGATSEAGAGRSSGGGAAAPLIETPAVKGPIKVGVMSTLSGGQKFVGEPPYRVALAYAKRLAAKGGINGRQLEILGYDVCTNCPDEGLAQAKKAVEKDDVFTMANTFVVNASLDQVVPYLVSKGVPMIQGASGKEAAAPVKSPGIFNVGLTVPNRAAIDADFAKRYLESKGLPKRVALLYFTDALNTYIASELRKALERVGLDIVDEEPVSYDATMTNQSSQVVKMRAAGAQMVVGAHGVLCAFNMQAARQANWGAPYVCTIMYDKYTSTYAGKAALEGRDVFCDTEGYATPDLSTPGVADYLDLMKNYYPDGDIGLITLYSYLGMRLIEEGVRSMGDNVTRAGLARYIEGLKNYDAGGLISPVTLGPRDHGDIKGAHIVRIKPDGSYDRQTAQYVYPDPVHRL